MLVNLVEPHWDAKETFPVGQVKDNDDTICALIVGIGDCAIAFLASRVPNLQLNCTLIDLKSSEAEVDANRTNVVFLETIILHLSKKLEIKSPRTYSKSDQQA